MTNLPRPSEIIMAWRDEPTGPRRAKSLFETIILSLLAFAFYIYLVMLATHSIEGWYKRIIVGIAVVIAIHIISFGLYWLMLRKK